MACLALPLVGCRAKAGATCLSEGEARCDGAAQMLVCMRGAWSAVACAGARGCSASGRFVDCDESVARAGDPCGVDGRDAHACSADARATMRCDGTTWTAHRACRGPKGCVFSPRFLDCDDSLAEEGDACDDGQRSCSVDGARLLACANGRMVAEAACAPGRCRADESFADCEEPGQAP